MPLSAHARLTISDDTRDLPGAFGGGCAALLEGVADEGSLNRAAKRMGMAYSKAWRIVREAEAHLNCELLTRDGARGSNGLSRGTGNSKGRLTSSSPAVYASSSPRRAPSKRVLFLSGPLV